MKLWKKLISRRGETLTETLVGVLIVGLASVVLVGMISAASHMNATAIKKDKALYDAVTITEQKSNYDMGTVRIKLKVTLDDTELHPSDNCPLFGDINVPLYSYSYFKEGTSP